MIRVLIVDDQPMIRSALSALVATAPDIDVVGEAADGCAAIEAARRLVPDVVIMDIRMPNMDGLTATARIRSEQPEAAVLVLTTYQLDEYVFDAIRSGASGFLLKDGDADELIRAIRACASGDAVMAGGPLRRLLDEFARQPKPDPAAAALIDTLTSRERDVLRHVATGLTNEEISHALIVSTATVKSHVGAVLTKLGVRDRTQATVLAHRAGLWADPRIVGHTIGAVTVTAGPGPHLGEMHPDGDELLHLVTGSMQLIIDDGDAETVGAETVVVLGPGDACVVPRGVWHRLIANETSILLHVTPGPNGEARPFPR